MSKELMVFEPGLPNTPGWSTLSEAKRQWLQEKTSNIKKFGAMEGLASVSAGIELLEVKNGLKGESMGITEYLKTVYGASDRVGFRKLAEMEELSKIWPPDLIRSVAERGSLLLQGTAGIGLKTLLNAARELPPPKDRDDKTIDAFIQHKVRTKLKEIKSIRRKGKVVKLADDDAMRILFNTGRRIMRAAKNLHTSADHKNFLKTVVGWWMEDRGVPGTLECKRVSIPDGTVAQVGRPRKKAGKMVAGLLLLTGSGTGLYWTLKVIEHLASGMAAN